MYNFIYLFAQDLWQQFFLHCKYEIKDSIQLTAVSSQFLDTHHPFFPFFSKHISGNAQNLSFAHTYLMLIDYLYIFSWIWCIYHDAAGHRRERTFMEKGVSAEFPGIQLNPPHLARRLCVSLAINRERGKYQQTKKQRKNGEISAKVPEDLPKYRSLRHKTNHTLNFGSIRMGTCIQKYGCKQLVSAVDALMPKMGIYEKFDVLTVIPTLRILENEFIFLVMLII